MRRVQARKRYTVYMVERTRRVYRSRVLHNRNVDVRLLADPPGFPEDARRCQTPTTRRSRCAGLSRRSLLVAHRDDMFGESDARLQ